ncbi:tRNA (N6-threonylcarbamoyladenosine(37)-N6)-methyltransferase TrmO [Alteromonas sp. C1M14]|nr:tRNA (N6-threonylcarbamoyladenosine(37)-N6)-methyltransferase TrmO [Alteromonas sp. C1M14]MBU2979127.1 tRNA (N6-threonylcarbamoyladenosine(37)-N6)-methyltransferase TrmO [Alteromonas sp. C1M14]
MPSIEPIGTITTPFKQKFAIPRQPNLANAKGVIQFYDAYANPHAFTGIEQYSHLWVMFHFHATAHRGWKPAVKAPRLGGNAKLGVFASRSTHRPNNIGLSVVKNGGVTVRQGKAVLTVFGVDLLDGTPIVDIKPYVAYADSLPHATDNLDTYGSIPQRPVIFSDTAQEQCAKRQAQLPDLVDLIRAVLSQDPRPAYRHGQINDDKIYKVALYDTDISWQVKSDAIYVLDIARIDQNIGS